MTAPRLQRYVNRLLARAEHGSPPGTFLQEDEDSLSGFATTTAIAPVYATFPLSVSLTTTLQASLLDIFAYIAWNHNAGVGLDRTAQFRFYLDGVLIAPSRGASEASVSGAIACCQYSRLLTVTPGVHTVTFEWAKASGTGSLIVNPTGLGAGPEVYGATLRIQEYVPP